MTKQMKKETKVCFAKLHNNLILLKIVNFHKYVGSLVNEIAEFSQTKISKRKGNIKRGVSQDINLCHQAATCLSYHSWACGLPVQVKRSECQPIHKVGAQIPHPFLGMKRANGRLCLQVVFKSSSHFFGVWAPILDPEKS